MPFTDLEGLNSFVGYDGDPADGPEQIVPPVPETVEHTGIPQQMIEQLVLKALYYKGEVIGRELASDLGLQFSVI
jgi:hypothetical protein